MEKTVIVYRSRAEKAADDFWWDHGTEVFIVGAVLFAIAVIFIVVQERLERRRR